MPSIDVKLSALNATAVEAKDIDQCSFSLDVLLKGELDGVSRKEMRGLKLGYRVLKDGKIIHEFSYPPKGVTLLRSDQLYLHLDRANLIPNEYYEMEFWTQKSGGAPDVTTYKFTTGKGAQHYPSWTWDDVEKLWSPPIPYPKDDKSYAWDEDKQDWVEVTEKWES